MCILCVIQKWSRRVATMLPWLVIPLIGLWALSQLLPPAFRFEITSPKLACVFVLLVTLFWYEILMPHLSAWRVRRNAQLRERKRTEAIELQKLRKTATRKCRNCLTPYRDQNPGGGRFMCSYCGHISKRPVLDLPIPPGLELSNSGLIKDLVGRSGKMLNGKAWSENGWICSQDWIENNNWVSGPVAGKSSHWRKNGTSSFFGGDDDCMAERSYSGLVIFACKLLTSFFMSIRWLWRKISRVSSSNELNSSDADHRAMLAKRGENGVNFHESRGEKARRKAEEKRQARLEKELEEEEERKQREEVARLVEERRKLRDEILEAERGISKSSTPSREKESKKEAERKRQERRKDKDKGSSKSNSDVEELDKKAGKESERKRDFEKKYETERRDHHKPGLESVKGQNFESGHVVKNSTPSSFGRGNTGSRYLDRMRGTFLSSSRAFGGTGFFGKTTSAPVMKENKFTNSVDHAHNSSFRRDICPPERVVGKLNALGDDKNANRPVILDPQPRVAPKKSWQQLFTRAGATTTPANSSVISRPNPKIQVDGNGPQLPGQPPVMQSFDNPISFGLPSPFTLSSHPSIPASGSLGFSPPVEPIFHHVVDRPCEIVPEEPELFEDPCYIPDPMSLLGPVSESLDNFQLDLGMDRPHTLKNVLVSPEVNKPSPIESPLARIRVTDDNHSSTSWLPTTPKAQDMHTLLGEDTNVNQTGTWQMWKSSPLGQDGLGLVGASGSWRLPQEWNKSTREDSLQPSSQKTMTSLFSNDDQVFSGTQSPRKSFVGNGLNGGVFSPSAGSSLVEPWLQKAAFPPLSGNDGHFPLNAQDESSQNEMIYGSVSRAATKHSFESSPVNCWSKKELAVQGSGEGFTNFAVTKPQTGSLSPPAPDVQSLWSFQ